MKTEINPKLKSMIMSRKLEVLMTIRNGKSVSKVYKEMNIQYCHLLDTINLFEQIKIIRSEKKGRERILFLTEKGNFLKENFIKINSMTK